MNRKKEINKKTCSKIKRKRSQKFYISRLKQASYGRKRAYKEMSFVSELWWSS